MLDNLTTLQYNVVTILQCKVLKPKEVTVFDKSQLLKGTLEGCILKTLSKEPMYAYGAIEHMRKKGFTDLAEGTIYPLLLRLEKQGLICSNLRDSAVGPKRKYYFITEAGRQYLNEFEREYCALEKIVKSIMEE